MENLQSINRNLERLAWGAFFIWWGVVELFKFLPEGTGLVGFGLILIALNVVRSLSGMRTSAFTITLGILALVWGGLELAGYLLSLPFQIPVLAILLIVLGAIVLARGTMGIGKE